MPVAGENRFYLLAFFYDYLITHFIMTTTSTSRLAAPSRFLLLMVAAHLVYALRCSPFYYEAIRTGIMSMSMFVGLLFACLCLYLGAILYALRWASARRLFLTAGLIFSLLAYAVLNKQWETFTPVLAFSGVFLGFLAYLMSGQAQAKAAEKNDQA